MKHDAARPLAARMLTTSVLLLSLLVASPGWAGSGQPRDSIVVHIAGMACPFCTYGVRKELSAISGVTGVQVSLSKSEATIDVDPGTKVTDAQIQQAIREAGFSPGQIERK